MLLRLVLGGAAFLVLAVLPGAWITFNRSARGMEFWDRLWIGIAAAPLVVAAQFYALGIAGVPFATNAVLLVLINLPAVWLMRRHGGPVAILPKADALVAAALSAIPIALCALHLASLQQRGFSGHGWFHSDIIYQIANGALRPEESSLAGMRLSYPWLLHVQMALQMFLLDEPPVSGFVWTNAVFLITVVGLTWRIAAHLGGDLRARIWSVLLLLFGLNFAGYTLREILPEAFTAAFPIWGDWRYTPWLRKYLVFGPMAAALPMLGAMLLVAVQNGRSKVSSYRLVVLGLLTCSLGMMYPLLFPAAIGLLGALALVELPWGRGSDPRTGWRRLGSLALVVAIGAVATLVVAAWTTVDRSSLTPVEISPLWSARRKAAESLLVLFPLLVGTAALVWRSRRREEIGAVRVLGLAGLASISLYVLFHIPHYRNEYKYAMTAAMALAPLAGIAVGSALSRIGRLPAMTVTVLCALLLAAPGFHRRLRWGGTVIREPVLDGREFALRIVVPEPLASALQTIRERTPLSSIIVATDHSLHLPTLASRSQYAPYADQVYPGINVPPGFMLIDVRGYPLAVLEERRRILERFYAAGSDEDRRAALQGMRALGRPLAVLVDEKDEGQVSSWLERSGEAEPIFRENGMSVWLVPASE